MSLSLGQPLALLLLLALPALWRVQARGAYASRRARRVALGLRLALTTLLALGLARPTLSWPIDRVAAVFVVDASESVGAATGQWARDWVAAARATRGPADDGQVVVFGAAPAVERAGQTARVDGSATDIAAALRLAAGLLPADGARRVVLLSDGQAGDESAREAALAEARRLGAAGIPLDAVALEDRDGRADARVVAVEAPARVREDEAAGVAVVVEATVAGPARVRLWTDGAPTADRLVDLTTGRARLALGQVPATLGFHAFRARVDRPGDAVPQNDELAGFSVVVPRPAVLVVAGPSADARPLQSALAASGIVAAVQPPAAITARPAELLRYDGVVLDDVPAASFSLDQMKSLESYVRDFGRGLVAVGGDRSYAQGGYADTPLDGLLPVSAKVPTVRKRVPVALLLLIDASESMFRGNARGTKMAMAKQAAADAVAALEDDDRISVMVFDTRAQTVVPYQPVGGAANRDRLRALISRIAPGGGTDILGALQAGLAAASTQSEAARHVVILTDGRVYDNGNYDDLIAALQREQITLSGIAVGDDADTELIRWLAERGGGRYYFTGDPAELPAVVVEETRLANRPAILEQPFRPTLASGPPIDGVSVRLPTLGGYALTSLKPGASLTLASPEGEALLAEWQFGLGRVVAWTSDAGQRWSGGWLSTEEFSRFWAGAVRWTLPSPLEGAPPARVEVAAGEATISVEATGAAGQPAAPGGARGIVTLPSGQQVAVQLRETAPGQYAGGLAVEAQGAYALRFTRDVEGAPAAGDLGGFVVRYPAEYGRSGTDRELLYELSRAAGGGLVADPASVFSRRAPGEASGPPRELWPGCLLAALALFVVEVAVRLQAWRLVRR